MNVHEKIYLEAYVNNQYIWLTLTYIGIFVVYLIFTDFQKEVGLMVYTHCTGPGLGMGQVSGYLAYTNHH